MDDKILYISMKLGTGVCCVIIFLSTYLYESHTPQKIFINVVFRYALHGLTTGFYNIVPMFFYKLSGKKHKEIVKDLEARRQ